MENLKITLLGIGGSGCNMINYVYKDFKDNKNIRLLSANTDIQSLNINNANLKIVLGNSGLGAGMKPEIGKISAEFSEKDIKKQLEGSNLLIIVTGLGGGTGSGASPVIVKYAKELGIQTVGLITLPFRFEGNKRNKIAKTTLSELENLLDSLIIIDNNSIFKIIDKKIGHKEALNEVNEILKKTLKAIINIVFNYNENDINVDFNDLRTILGHKGKGIFTYSKGNTAKEAIENVLNNKLFEYINLEKANGILVNFTLNEKYPLTEIEEAMNFIYEHANENTDIIFGTYTNNDIKEVEVAVIITGINNQPKQKRKIDIMNYFTSIRKEIKNENFDDILDQPTFLRMNA